MTPTNEQEADLIRTTRTRTLESVGDWLTGTERRLEEQFEEYKRVAKTFLLVCVVALIVASVALAAFMQRSYRHVASVESGLNEARKRLEALEYTLMEAKALAIKQNEIAKETIDLAKREVGGEMTKVFEQEKKAIQDKVNENIGVLEAQKKELVQLGAGEGETFEKLRDSLVENPDVISKIGAILGNSNSAFFSALQTTVLTSPVFKQSVASELKIPLEGIAENDRVRHKQTTETLQLANDRIDQIREATTKEALTSTLIQGLRNANAKELRELKQLLEAAEKMSADEKGNGTEKPTPAKGNGTPSATTKSGGEPSPN